MYSSFQLAKKFIHYYLTASNGKGHGIHSPFVFNFIKFVLNDKKKYKGYASIESVREGLLKNKDFIEVEDFGAGSAIIKTNKRIVSDVAASSLKSKKYSQLLFRMIQYYKPDTILELGTSFGVTTSYLAYGNKNSPVYTLEGSSSIASIALKNFEKQSLTNIKLLQGNFEHTLPLALSALPVLDFIFIDGNHRKEPTVEYFRKLLNNSRSSTILVFDDIHWSPEMEEAWIQIQQDNAVTLTIDLFFIGMVFINPAFKVKQHFKIRF